MERIIGNAVHAALNQRMTPKEALRDAAHKLSDAIK
jgi:maltose-binding protein MalE